MPIITKVPSRLTTVGVKILVEVILASNLFIGALLYVHLTDAGNGGTNR